MDGEKKVTFDQYLRMRDRNTDYARALARTNLAIRCWEKAGGKVWYLPLMWMLDNHIVQAFYKRSGIDVQPESVGGMYGYGRTVGVFPESCRGVKKPRMLGRISTGSSAAWNPKIQKAISMVDALEHGENPIGTIERAALAAVGGWPSRCTKTGCQHQKDAEVYLTIFQIVTLYVVMGQSESTPAAGVPILGTELRSSPDWDRANHPLHQAGFLKNREFSYDWFDVMDVWIHRRTGTLVCFEHGSTRTISYADWCGGSVEKGLRWLLERKG